MLPMPWSYGCRVNSRVHSAHTRADSEPRPLRAGILRGCLQLDAPAHHNRLLCFLPDGEMRPPPPSAARWTTICSSLLLTQAQVRLPGESRPNLALGSDAKSRGSFMMLMLCNTLQLSQRSCWQPLSLDCAIAAPCRYVWPWCRGRTLQVGTRHRPAAVADDAVLWPCRRRSWCNCGACTSARSARAWVAATRRCNTLACAPCCHHQCC